MKTFLKSLVIAFCCVSCFTPFSVFAEEDIGLFVYRDDMANLTDNQRSKVFALYFDSPSESNLAIFQLANNGNLIWSTDFTIDSSNDTITFTVRNILRPDDTTSVNTSSSTDSYLTNENTTYFFLKYNNEIYFQSSQFPELEINWSADFSNILSNPFISDLVGYSYDIFLNDWYINYLVYRTPLATDGYITKTLGYRYMYSLYDSSGELVRSVIVKETPGTECAEGNSSLCRPLTFYNHVISNDTVLRSSWLSASGSIEVNDSKGNQLIESGNSNSQSASSSVDSITSDLNISSGRFEEFESQFNDNLTSSLSVINLDSVQFGNSSDFVKTASWVKVQFDHILDSSGLFKSSISFVLIVGLALLLIGRRL